MTAQPRVTGGVDTHADVHVAAALDSATGRLLGTEWFPTTAAGYGALLAWLRAFGELDRVGVESTGAWGAGLTRHLRSEGVEVIEVDRPDRKARRFEGKSDPTDAEAAARAVLSGRAQARPRPRTGSPTRSARSRSCTTERSRTAPAPSTSSRRCWSPYPSHCAPTCVRSRSPPSCNGPAASPPSRRSSRPKPAGAARAGRARQVPGRPDRPARGPHRQAHRPGVPGAGRHLRGRPHVAAQLLAVAGDNPHRMTSEAAFAKLCGACPIPASSGKTTRHRLNRGGDRRANNARSPSCSCGCATTPPPAPTPPDEPPKARPAKRSFAASSASRRLGGAAGAPGLRRGWGARR